MSDKRATADRYAQAVLEAMVERWQSTLDSVAAAVAGDRKLAALLADPAKSADEKNKALTKVLPADTAPEISNLLKLLVQQGELTLIPEISDALARSASGQRAPTKAEIISAVELSSADQEKLRKSITEQYGEGLIFSFRVDPALLGGLRVRVGDRLIDNSVASRLAKLRESIASAVR